MLQSELDDLLARGQTILAKPRVSKGDFVRYVDLVGDVIGRELDDPKSVLSLRLDAYAMRLPRQRASTSVGLELPASCLMPKPGIGDAHVQHYWTDLMLAFTSWRTRKSTLVTLAKRWRVRSSEFEIHARAAMHELQREASSQLANLLVSALADRADDLVGTTVELDPTAGMLKVGGRSVELSPAQVVLVERLRRAAPRSVPCARLPGTPGSIRSTVSNLRSRLSTAGIMCVITKIGGGYRLDEMRPSGPSAIETTKRADR